MQYIKMFRARRTRGAAECARVHFYDIRGRCRAVRVRTRSLISYNDKYICFMFVIII